MKQFRRNFIVLICALALSYIPFTENWAGKAISADCITTFKGEKRPDENKCDLNQVTAESETAQDADAPLAYPDLVVSDILITAAGVDVVIINQGKAAVVDDFWVDLYIDPNVPPVTPGATWVTQGGEGIVWGVMGETIASGETLILNFDSPHYRMAESDFSGVVANGAAVYAQVDSVNQATSYGSVLEGHEVDRGAYNNILFVVYAGDS